MAERTFGGFTDLVARRPVNFTMCRRGLKARGNMGQDT
jgi:hypothetical protein